VRTILVGECVNDHLYRIEDPDAPSESQFEFFAAKAFSCMYCEYQCIVFGGGFKYDDRIYRPDLALISRDFSHWFVIEVELSSHSFDGHVLPQVKAFRYGDPQGDCIAVLSRELRISQSQANTLLSHVPRRVVVVANRHKSTWEIALKAHDIQYLILSIFRSGNQIEALELEGSLDVIEEHLGFGKYSATDRSLFFPKTLKLAPGTVQINDPSGSVSSWTVIPAENFTCVTKDVGVPDIPDGSYVQVIRAIGGRISLRRPD
jgi:hypothetical protein